MRILRIGIFVFAVFHIRLTAEGAPQAQAYNQSTSDRIPSGYVAEWDYIEKEDKRKNTVGAELVNNNINLPDASFLNPSERIDPATWLDSEDTWWLFGGRGPNQSETLSDLWAYNLNDTQEWTPIFLPLHATQSPTSAYPEELRHPLLCGSLANRHLSVFGGWGKEPSDYSATQKEIDPVFREDNTVWLYDIPEHEKQSNGLWTSYICCDACLPDQNTTLEFCPHFDEVQQPQPNSDQVPLIWCSKDSLMALQPPTHKSESLKMSNSSFEWWKFDLEATEWVKLDPFDSDGSIHSQHNPFHPDCRSAHDKGFVYVLCPSVELLSRDIYVLNLEKKEVHWLAKIASSSHYYENEGTVEFFAIEFETQSVLIIAYERLLDFWLHDQSNSELKQLENIWRGSSLDLFQHSFGFYDLTITFLNISRNIRIINPRTNLKNFNISSSRSFHVHIQPDSSVFLPLRDAPVDSATTQTTVSSSTSSPTPTLELPTSSSSTPTLISTSQSVTEFSLSRSSLHFNSSSHVNPERITTTTSVQLEVESFRRALGNEGRKFDQSVSSNPMISSTELKSNLRQPHLPSEIKEIIREEGSRKPKVAAVTLLPHQKEDRENGSRNFVIVGQSNGTTVSSNQSTEQRRKREAETRSGEKIMIMDSVVGEKKRLLEKGFRLQRRIGSIDNERGSRESNGERTKRKVRNRGKVPPRTNEDTPTKPPHINDSLHVKTQENNQILYPSPFMENEMEHEEEKAEAEREILEDSVSSSSESIRVDFHQSKDQPTGPNSKINESNEDEIDDGNISSGNEYPYRRKMGKEHFFISYLNESAQVDHITFDMSDYDKEQHQTTISKSTSVSSLLFFSICISFFILIGITMFIRTCVKCPPNEVRIKEQPTSPVRYFAIPDELNQPYNNDENEPIP